MENGRAPEVVELKVHDQRATINEGLASDSIELHQQVSGYFERPASWTRDRGKAVCVMGQIRKRGSVYWIRYYRNGQRIEESAGTTKYDEARDLLRDREGDISKGVPITARSTRLTFDDAAKDVVADYTVNGKRSKRNLERRIALHLTPSSAAGG